MKQLQDYFYLQSQQHGVLGWVTSVDHGMEILGDTYEMTAYEQEAARVTMKMAFKFYYQPDADGRTRSIYPMGGNDGKVIVLNGMMDNDDKQLAVMSPMLMKGLSARLATLYVSGDEIYLVRVSEESALSQDPYLALLDQDVDGFWRNGYPVRREHHSRKELRPEVPSHIVVRNGSHSTPLQEMSIHGICEALERLGIRQVEGHNLKLMEFLCTMYQTIDTGRLRIYATSIWQHHETGGIQIGNNPVTYGHPGAYQRAGSMCGDMVSGRPGRMVQMVVSGLSVVIDRVED